MSRGVRWYLLSSVVLVALAGCGRSYFQYGEREPWRREAEVACLNSGTVKEGAGIVRIEPIEGPGICGADFPFKVSALGESSALGYADEAIRPPGAIPGAAHRAAAALADFAIALSAAAPQSYAPPPQAGEPMSIHAPGAVIAPEPAPAPGRPTGSLARRRPICARRRIGSAPASPPWRRSSRAAPLGAQPGTRAG